MKRREAEERMRAASAGAGVAPDARRVGFERRYIEHGPPRPGGEPSFLLTWVATYERWGALHELAIDDRTGEVVRERR